MADSVSIVGSVTMSSAASDSVIEWLIVKARDDLHHRPDAGRPKDHRDQKAM